MDFIKENGHDTRSINIFDPISSQGSDQIFEALEVTKMPFEKSVSKLIEVHSSV